MDLTLQSVLQSQDGHHVSSFGEIAGVDGRHPVGAELSLRI